MLKLTYTENGFRMDLIGQSLENWVSTRVILALRSATTISIEPSTASFLLPSDLPDLGQLEQVKAENGEILELSPCDAEYVEVVLQGTWVAADPETEEGIFVVSLSHRAEFFLFKLWEEVTAVGSIIN